MQLIIDILATWRLSALFIHDRGPFRIFERLREDVAEVHIVNDDDWPETQLGQLLSCIWCFSIWAGIIMVLIGKRRTRWAARALALSGGAILIEEVRGWR